MNKYHILTTDDVYTVEALTVRDALIKSEAEANIQQEKILGVIKDGCKLEAYDLLTFKRG